MTAQEKPSIDEVNRPQPIGIAAPPKCFQDGSTFRKTRMECILCDHFNECKKTKFE